MFSFSRMVNVSLFDTTPTSCYADRIKQAFVVNVFNSEFRMGIANLYLSHFLSSCKPESAQRSTFKPWLGVDHFKHYVQEM